MNKELKAKWVEALRSGKYKQTKGRLQSVNGKAYCCLGVLEHCVMGVEYDALYRINADDIDDLPCGVRNPAPATLRSAGLSKIDALPLWRMNDEDGAGFPIIADYIEANL